MEQTSTPLPNKKKRERKKKEETILAVPNPPQEQLTITGKHITYDLRSPQDIGRFAKVLQKFISDGKLSMKFRQNDKEEYVLSDGWKFAALNFGLTPRIDSCEKISAGDVYHVFYEQRNGQNGSYEVAACVTNIDEEIEERKASKDTKRFTRIREITYKVKCSLVNIATGEVIGDGEALCSNLETKKLAFDQYAVMSMAQTRAISKACKNLLGFVMRAAGFAETPAEEMAEDYTHTKTEVTGAPESIKNQSAKIADNDMDEIKANLKLLNTHEEINNYGLAQTPALQKNLAFRGLLMKRKTEITNTPPVK